MSTHNPPNALPVALGAAAGGLLRHTCLTRAGAHVPALTLVNVAGSFALGTLQTLPMVKLRPRVAAALITGFCGGFTTFSTFAARTVDTAKQKHLMHAFGYVLVNCALASAAVVAGRAVGGLQGR